MAESIAMAIRSVVSHRLRTALTTLGIVIGVSAVIVLVGLGDGMKAGFNAQFGPLATQLLLAKTPGSVPGGGPARELTDADVRALANPAAAADIAAVSGVLSGTALATYNQHQYRVSVAGANPDYLAMANRTLVAGTFFTAAARRDDSRVVVLGIKAVSNLLGVGPRAALKRTVRIGRARFTVLGVLVR